MRLIIRGSNIISKRFNEQICELVIYESENRKRNLKKGNYYLTCYSERNS